MGSVRSMGLFREESSFGYKQMSLNAAFVAAQKKKAEDPVKDPRPVSPSAR